MNEMNKQLPNIQQSLFLPNLQVSTEEQNYFESFALELTNEYQKKITKHSKPEEILAVIHSLPLDEFKDKRTVQEVVIANGLQHATKSLTTFFKDQKQSIGLTTNIDNLDEEDEDEFQDEIDDKNEMLAGRLKS